MKSSIFLQESSWAAAWGAGWPPHRVVTAREQHRGMMGDVGLNVRNKPGSVLTFLWFGAPQGGSGVRRVRRFDQVTRPGVRQAGEQVGFTCSLQGLLDLSGNKHTFRVQPGQRWDGFTVTSKDLLGGKNGANQICILFTGTAQIIFTHDEHDRTVDVFHLQKRQKARNVRVSAAARDEAGRQ